MSASAWLRRPRVAAALGLGLALLFLAGARFVRSVGPPGVATADVHTGRFVRDVVAGGTFKAVKATPIVAPLESGREQKIAVLARDGSLLKAGDLVVEFDPWGAQKEAADGNADVAAADAKIAKSKAEAGKSSRSLSLDRDVAKEELDRAETFQITDTQLYSRTAIIESGLDRDLYTKKADVAGRKLATSGKLSDADRALGEIEAGKARVKVAMAEKSLQDAAHPGPPRRPAAARKEMERGDGLRGRLGLAGPEDRRRSPTFRSSRPRSSCSRPTPRGSRPGSGRACPSKAGRERSTRPRCRASTPWPSPASSSRR